VVGLPQKEWRSAMNDSNFGNLYETVTDLSRIMQKMPLLAFLEKKNDGNT
jgi:hypothetical protein